MIAVEVNKLLNMGFIREVTYLEWIFNIAMVKKANKKSWFYIEFTNLNKACLKDSYLLLRTDQMVDATSSHDLLSFMDAFSSYN